MARESKRQTAKRTQEAIKQQAIQGDINQPDIARLVARFFEVAGGEQAVAKMLYDEFQGAKPGSLVRSRILDMILRGVKYANESMPRGDDLGMLTEADLLREFTAILEEAEEVSGDAERRKQAGGKESI